MSRLLLPFLFFCCFTLQAKNIDAYIGFNRSNILLPSNKVKLSQLIYYQSIKGKKDEGNAILELEITVSNGILSAQKVIEFIDKQSVANNMMFVWRGNTTTLLNLTNEMDSLQRINEFAKESITRKLKKKFPQVEVNNIQSVKTSRQTPYFDSIRIKENGQFRVSKRMAIWVELIANQVVVNELPVWFNVKIYDYVLVANERIPSSHRINKSMCDSVLMEVTSNSNSLYRRFPGQGNYWAIRELKTGEVLEKKNIALEPDVKINQIVVVEYSIKNISIETRGKALKQGFVGEKILVDIEESSRPISAQILTENKVKVVNSDV